MVHGLHGHAMRGHTPYKTMPQGGIWRAFGASAPGEAAPVTVAKQRQLKKGALPPWKPITDFFGGVPYAFSGALNSTVSR